MNFVTSGNGKAAGSERQLTSATITAKTIMLTRNKGTKAHRQEVFGEK